MNATQTSTRASRKRKRSGESLSEDSEDGSKRRGRPRTEKPDESTADVSLLTMFSYNRSLQYTIQNGKTNLNSSVEEHRFAWLKEPIDRERKRLWTTYESVSQISLPL
jgi:hypothetical protein